MQSVPLTRVEVPDYNLGLRGKLLRGEKTSSDSALAFCSILYGLTLTDRVVDNSFSNANNGYPDHALRIWEDTRIALPWRNNTSAVIADLIGEDGNPFPASPRGALLRLTERYQALELTPVLGYEFEFWVFHDDDPERPDGVMRPLGRVSDAYNWTRMASAADLVEEFISRMDAVGIPVEAFHTELGPGLFEFALAPLPAVQAADAAVRAKLYMRELCSERGLAASFMAKPFGSESGAGGHVHSSIVRNTQNVFAEQPGVLSTEGERYLGGLLHTMSDFMVLFAPHVNSYKRIDPAQYVSSTPSWGMDDRSSACRLLLSNQKAARVEHRIAGADVSPYFSAAALLAGGIYGLENKLDLDAVTARVQADSLPTDLRSAADKFGNSELARELFEDLFVEAVTASRLDEVTEYETWLRTHITSWERSRHLERH